MTLLEIIDASRVLLKDNRPSTRSFPDNSSSFYTDSEMTDWVNIAQRDVQTKLVQTFENWFVTSTSVTLVAGTEEYSGPTDCLKIVRVEDVENEDSPIEVYPLSFNDKDRYSDRYDIGVTANGNVHTYSIKGNNIIFRPKPRRSITDGIKIYYEQRVPNITSASTISIIPQEYHDLLVWNTVEYGLMKGEANPETMNYVVGRRMALEKQLITSAEDRQVQKSRQVKRKKRSF